MSAPSSADVAAFSREALGRRQVATGLRPLVEALGIALPPREAESRGSRRGLRHYSKDEYIDALMAYRDALLAQRLQVAGPLVVSKFNLLAWLDELDKECSSCDDLPSGRRATLFPITPDDDGVWYGPGAPLGHWLTVGIRD
eukprot:COSAG02_NODE_1208_length_13883_cov_54.757998_2_plen_142_part_00